MCGVAVVMEARWGGGGRGGGVYQGEDRGTFCRGEGLKPKISLRARENEQNKRELSATATGGGMEVKKKKREKGLRTNTA